MKRRTLLGIGLGALAGGCRGVPLDILSSGTPLEEDCNCDSSSDFDFDSLSPREIMYDASGQFWEGDTPLTSISPAQDEVLDLALNFEECDDTKVDRTEKCYFYRDGSVVCETSDKKYKVRVGGLGSEQIICSGAPGGNIPRGNTHTHFELTIAGKSTGTIHFGKYQQIPGKWCIFAQRKSFCSVICTPDFKKVKGLIQAVLIAAAAAVGVTLAASIASALADALAIIVMAMLAI